MYVLENENMDSWEGLSNIWIDPLTSPNYYPMTFTSFWLEHRIWQGDPRGYHLTNVLLHLANTCLLFLLLSRLGVRWALCAAALFALHPVNVESVAWIAERKNVLSLFFSLLALLAWLKWEDEGDRRFLFHTYIAFIAALLSKTVACVFPAVLLALIAYRSPSRFRSRLTPVAPMFVLSLLLGVVTIWWERVRMGAAEAAADLSLLDRVLAAGKIPWFYLQKTLFPFGLYPVYPAWSLDPADPIQWIWPVLTLVVLAGAWALRNRIGSGLLLLVALYLVILGPSQGFIDHSTMDLSLVADHYYYHASIVVMVGLASGFAWLVASVGKNPATVQPIATAMIAIPLAILTMSHASTYATSESLWRHGLEGNPSSWAVRTNYGAALMDVEKYPQALEQYLAAQKIRPDHIHLRLNVGDAYGKMGQLEKARETYLSTLEVDPDFAAAYYKVGRLEQGFERMEEAEAAFKKAIEMNPAYQEAHNSLGVLYAMNGRLDDAMRAFQEVLILNPDHKGAYRNMMTAYLEREGAFKKTPAKDKGVKTAAPAAVNIPPATSSESVKE